MKKKHIWQKAFSLSFVFHLVVIITVGSLVAGFHEEIQRSQEQFITVNLADMPGDEQETPEEASPLGSFKEIFQPARADSLPETVKETAKQKNDTLQTSSDNTSASSSGGETADNAGMISATDGILPDTGNGSGGFSAEGAGVSDGGGTGSGDIGGSESYGSEGSGGNGNGSGSGATEDRYSVASRFAQAVEANKSYPYAAVRLNQQGVVTVNVTIDADGNLVGASVVSSGGKNLDKAALNAVYASCPFPHGLNDSINMDVPVHFYLN